MKTVKSNNYKMGGAVGATGIQYESGGNKADKTCPGENCPSTSSGRGQRARQSANRAVNRQNKRNKKSLNTGSNRRRVDRSRIVKIDKPGLIDRIRENRERRKRNKERDLGRYVSPRYM